MCKKQAGFDPELLTPPTLWTRGIYGVQSFSDFYHSILLGIFTMKQERIFLLRENIQHYSSQFSPVCQIYPLDYRPFWALMSLCLVTQVLPLQCWSQPVQSAFSRHWAQARYRQFRRPPSTSDTGGRLQLKPIWTILLRFSTRRPASRGAENKLLLWGSSDALIQ